MAGRIIRLRSRRDFQELYSHARAYHGEHLILLLHRTGRCPGKVACVASRKVGSAVRRNRARRVLREAFRTLGVDLSKHDVHIGLVARQPCAQVGMPVVRAEMRRLLVAAGILNSTGSEER